MKNVLVIQRRMTHYRIKLFDLMRENLVSQGVVLGVVYGQAAQSELSKRDSAELSWGTFAKNKYLLEGRLCWQSIGMHIAKSDLVIVTQENKLLSNYPLLLGRRHYKLAFWGHGGNLQAANPNSLKERFKRWTTNQVDWWFAYTQMSVGLVQQCGFPTERITDLENAVDTTELLEQQSTISSTEIDQLKQNLGINHGQVGLYLGSLYEEKRLDFLFAAAQRLKQQVPHFHLVIVGDGPMRPEVEVFCAAHPDWCHYVGIQKGRDKMLYLSLANVVLNPGLVGLGILDSFVAGVPMATTDCGLHSPEVAYLENGVNGVMTANTLEAYVAAVTRILSDEQYASQLKQSAKAAAAHYTIENMANNFCAGILQALKS
ncbi:MULTISPECIES: glycosyltransferase family 4 protein [Deefgea]|uniref:Glycosyltransferase n=1 Tax=Deefgea chitinilytica TaxID=570276 RepID=A0ABS2CDY6_9NEIS|nr:MULTISPECIES: glycosyltransferase family 4 protein [Deefgea]MBM5572353.1 glycosyltransferase [Deefgea chitinilytica]MBM9889589.1 glycosyltransferase family 4 protein [Deefgea sp. CFH1-16]